MAVQTSCNEELDTELQRQTSQYYPAIEAEKSD
jgi:hypothetical protein